MLLVYPWGGQAPLTEQPIVLNTSCIAGFVYAACGPALKLHIAEVVGEGLIGLAGSPSLGVPKPDVLGGVASLVPALLVSRPSSLVCLAQCLRISFASHA